MNACEGDPDGVLSSWLRPGPALEVVGVWESKPVDGRAFFLPALHLSALQIKVKLDRRVCLKSISLMSLGSGRVMSQ